MLFVDEIHRLSPAVEEILYPALEDYQLDIMIEMVQPRDPSNSEPPPFTLVGATTRAGLLTSPLRDRFGIVQRLEFYPSDELAMIAERSARILGLTSEQDGIEATQGLLAQPRALRIANRLLRRVRILPKSKRMV